MLLVPVILNLFTAIRFQSAEQNASGLSVPSHVGNRGKVGDWFLIQGVLVRPDLHPWFGVTNRQTELPGRLLRLRVPGSEQVDRAARTSSTAQGTGRWH